MGPTPSSKGSLYIESTLTCLATVILTGHTPGSKGCLSIESTLINMFSYCYPYGSYTISKGSLYYIIYFNMFSYCYPYGSYTCVRQ